MDAQLAEKIVHEVKSQGVFDEFRKDSMADVDTKPAYQNLRQRVENTVKKFLAEQKWTMETNKNQLREKLRRHISESGFLDVGVERIVDQVVNPKIGSVFQPRIEEIAYKYLGLPTPPKKFEPPPPPLMHPLPPLPLNAPPLKVETSSLLPTDLEQVSPDSDITVKSEGKDDTSVVDMDTEDKLIDDEDESPPFEPLDKHEIEETSNDLKVEKQQEINVKQECYKSMIVKENRHEESRDDVIKAEAMGTNNESMEASHFTNESAEKDKEASQSVDARISQDSQLSSVSSDSCLSTDAKDDSLQCSSQEAVAANISEEAQMPNFNENSCEPSATNGNVCENISSRSELHFDIKKDEIKFEGTERKSGLETLASVALENNIDSLSTNKSSGEVKDEDRERTSYPQELSFCSSMEDSSSVTPSQTPKNTIHNKEQDLSPVIQTPIATQILTPPLPTPTANPSPLASIKPDRDQSRCSSSSSSKHKKHSKERRRSYEHEKDKDSRERHRSGKDVRESSKYHSSSGRKSSSRKHSSSSSSSKVSSSHSKTTEKYIEKSSSYSAHSSLKNTKNTQSHSSSSSTENHESKKSKRDSDRRHHASSSSKRNERKDDHSEAKNKIQRRRKSTDSNDDDGDKSIGGGKYGSQYKSNYSLTGSKSSKSSVGENNKSSTSKTSDCQKDQMKVKESNQDCAGKFQHQNHVVILNDILENFQTQYIQLNSNGHVVEIPLQYQQQHCSIETESSKPTSAEIPVQQQHRSIETETNKPTSAEIPVQQQHRSIEISKPTSAEIAVQHQQNSIETESSKPTSAEIPVQQQHRSIEIETTKPTSAEIAVQHQQRSIETESSKPTSAEIPVQQQHRPIETETNKPTSAKIPEQQQQCSIETETSKPTSAEFNNNIEEKPPYTSDLLFFEEIQVNIMDRIRLLNDTMDLFRIAVNSLRFDSLSDEGIELSNEEDVNSDNNKKSLLTETLKRKSHYNYEEFETTPRKRCISNDSEGRHSKTSPTPSDASSVNSKENEEVHKNTYHARKSVLDRHKAVQKLSHQQRYSSEDLYKPRPILGQRSRRRGMDSLL